MLCWSAAALVVVIAEELSVASLHFWRHLVRVLSLGEERDTFQEEDRCSLQNDYQVLCMCIARLRGFANKVLAFEPSLAT